MITLIAKFLYNLKFKIDQQFVAGLALQVFLAMLAFISIGILIANFAKNTRVVSTIGNTLFPANSWPKEVKQVVKYFSMNNLWDALR